MRTLPTDLPASLGPLVATLAELHCALDRQRTLAEGDDALQRARARRELDALEAERQALIESIDDLVMAAARARRSGGDHG